MPLAWWPPPLNFLVVLLPLRGGVLRLAVPFLDVLVVFPCRLPFSFAHVLVLQVQYSAPLRLLAAARLVALAELARLLLHFAIRRLLARLRRPRPRRAHVPQLLLLVVVTWLGLAAPVLLTPFRNRHR